MSNEIPMQCSRSYRPRNPQHRPRFNGDCDYAVVRLTPELVDLVRRRVELARQAVARTTTFTSSTSGAVRRSSTAATCWTPARKPWQTDQAAQDWLAGLEQNGHALVPPAADLAACQPQRVGVRPDGRPGSPSSSDPEYEIAWTASPKHTDVYVTTRDLPLAALEGYAGNEQTG